MSALIDVGVYRSSVSKRNRRGKFFQRLYLGSIFIAIGILVVLLITIVNQTVGLVAQDFEVNPSELSERPLEELSAIELVDILEARVPGQLLVFVRDNYGAVANDQFTGTPLGDAVSVSVPDEIASIAARDLPGPERNAAFAQILELNMTPDELRALIDDAIIKTVVNKPYSLIESLLNRAAIEAEVAERYPESTLVWKSWLNSSFLSSLNSTRVVEAGIGPALAGTAFLLVLTIMISLPLGIGAAIYLEEYASDNWLNRLIETNIRNLAGVPSIIYGMLGLTVFVRALNGITQGSSILSGALTLSLLILPVIITSAREALRAVSSQVREASYGLGATKWQTISRQVLPVAVPGILTGLILGVSRAIGETAPLIVIGATNSISTFPDSPFSRFAVLPFTIYNWTSQPDAAFKNAASAAIVVLLILLLSINSIAIILRNRAVNQRV
jgi:phosphate transport system permease protein